MKTRRSITVFVLALIQTVFWTPYLLDPPWTLPSPHRVDRWILWLPGTFDFGTATDFIPAVAMVVAGVLAMIVGLRRGLASSFVRWAIRADGFAILVLTAMLSIGTLAGVVLWPALDGWLLLTVLVWFAPPIASIVFMSRHRQSLGYAA